MNSRNRRVILASRPHGEPSADNFRFEEAEVPEPGPDQALLRTHYLSLDPYMRGRMNEGESYAPPVELGEVMEGRGVCEVVKSNIPALSPGTMVLASCGWQEFPLTDGSGVQPIDKAVQPLTYALGVLGMPGLTAYTGLLNIGKPKPGETLVVAAASGAVGSVVGQLAKIKGCKVVGIAGGEKKCRYVKGELGFDDCLDHRAPELRERLRAACPDGIDIYFENVGGAVFEAVLPLLNYFSRIPLCGLIAHYNATELPPGPNTLPLFMQAILVKRITVRGFIVGDFAAQWPEFLRDMSGWLREEKIRYREDITAGLEHAPNELIALLRGENFGKKIIDLRA